MIGLLLVYQLLDGWQRVRRWCGQPVSGLAVNLRAGPGRHSLWLITGAFMLGFGGTVFAMHHEHLHAEVLTMVDTAAQMCRALR